MKIRVYCQTNMVGSTVEKVIDVPDDELAAYEMEYEREELMEDYARTEVFDTGTMFEWGWEPAS